MKIHAVAIAALLSVSSLAVSQGQNTPRLRQAHDAYLAAQSLESELNERLQSERTRAEYLKVIRAYQRVYLITPRTGYADNSLMTIARLYEEMKDPANAIKTLNFLIREYPSTPFRDAAEKDVARLSGAKVLKTGVVENVRYWDSPNHIQIVIDTTGEIAFNQGDARDPDRIFFDISPAKLNSMLKGKQWPVESSLVKKIRVGQYANSTVRVVLETGIIGRVTSLALQDPDRLVVDIFAKDAITQVSAPEAPAPALATAVPPEATKAVPAPPAALGTLANPTPDPPASINTAPKKAEPEVKAITPARPPNSGSRTLVRSLGLKLSRVVIDAGHGGHDTGTVGPSGYAEKELVLDVAQRLKKLIETELGADVVMTRQDDNFVPLESRTAIANREQADLFLSIHANSSAVRSVRGVETYFLNFTSSREALETASRENAASERSIHELQDLVKKIMLRDKVDESRELARHISKSLAARKGSGIDRGVKQAPFVVLIGAEMPSVLAEICFISNPQDEKLVKAAETRQAIAESLFEGVRSYAETLSGTKTAKTQEKTN
jgi:N-acetylmuramoyl-L-alanine amidase